MAAFVIGADDRPQMTCPQEVHVFLICAEVWKFGDLIQSDEISHSWKGPVRTKRRRDWPRGDFGLVGLVGLVGHLDGNFPLQEREDIMSDVTDKWNDPIRL